MRHSQAGLGKRGRLERAAKRSIKKWQHLDKQANVKKRKRDFTTD